MPVNKYKKTHCPLGEQFSVGNYIGIYHYENCPNDSILRCWNVILSLRHLTRLPYTCAKKCTSCFSTILGQFPLQ